MHIEKISGISLSISYMQELSQEQRTDGKQILIPYPILENKSFCSFLKYIYMQYVNTNHNIFGFLGKNYAPLIETKSMLGVIFNRYFF